MTAPRSRLPLEGIRVVEFSRVWAGPVLGHLLADLGAEVIRVESRRNLDMTRRWGPWFGGEFDPDDAIGFPATNRNKLGVTIDLSRIAGIELSRKLIAHCDVMTENYGAQTTKKLGLDYESVSSIRAGLIVASLSATGRSGPLRDMSAYGTGLGALAGFEYLAGYEDGRPLGTQLAYTDPAMGAYGAFIIMAAIRYRNRMGRGLYIDLSHLEAPIGLIPYAILDQTMNGRIARPLGNKHRWMAPHGCYPCKGEDRWIAIACGTEDEWKALVVAMGDPTWAAVPELSDMVRRKRHEEDLDRRIAEWTRQFNHRELMERLQAVGVAAVATLNTREVEDDPHYRARRTLGTIPHRRLGEMLVYGFPWKLERTPAELRTGAPSLGGDNEYVFQEILGLSKEEVAKLKEDQVTY